MKKIGKRILVLLIACLLIWTVFPRPFSWLIPQRMVNGGQDFRAHAELSAVMDFSAAQEEVDAFSDLGKELEGVWFWAVPTTLLPFLHQPRNPAKVKIDYYDETGFSGGHSATTLLWDGHILWVNWLGSHYLGYVPVMGGDVDGSMQQLAEKYGG